MYDLDLTIRVATAEDAAPLGALLARVFTATYGAVIPESTLESYLQQAFAPTQVAADLGRADSRHLVATNNSTIIGISKLVDGQPEGHHLTGAVELARLYVDQLFHGCGVAGALLKRTLADARERGYTTVWLCAWEHNQRAWAFYRKHGFVLFGRAPVFVDTIRFDDLLMRRTLDDY